MNIQILIDEFTDDPKVLGYSSMTDQERLDKLLEIGASNETKTRGFIESQKLVEALDAAEFLALTTNEQNLFLAIVSSESLKLTSKLKATLVTLFGTSTVTKAAMQTLAQEPISRAESIGWPNVALGNVTGARP